MSDAEQPVMGDGAPTGFKLSSEVASALSAQGPSGERARDLLQTAALILSAPAGFPAAAEVVQGCCRSALDSILKLAGPGIQGVRSAEVRVIADAEALVAASRRGQTDLTEFLNELGSAVDVLGMERNEPGGQRIRQVGSIVLDQTGWQMGAAEREAARESWSRFYKDASGTLHGSAADLGAAAEMWEGLVQAIGQLFLQLPERAEELRDLALLPDPGPGDAKRAAMMTDPRAGRYFFRAAMSPRWLELLRDERLLPDLDGEVDRWPAWPYLARQLDAEPVRICSWVEGQLARLEQRGPAAVGMAVQLLRNAGADAVQVMRKVARSSEDRSVLAHVAVWAAATPVADRDSGWVNVVETILKKRVLTESETWECGQLLSLLVETAHPQGCSHTGDDSLVLRVRHVLAGTLADYLAEERARWTVESVHDLAAVSVSEGRHEFVVLLLRAVLDLARADARCGVGLETRLKPLSQKPIDSDRGRERIIAVHLRECDRLDHTVEGQDAAAEWWKTALSLLSQLAGLRTVHADVYDFVQHVFQTAGDDLPAAESALLDGLDPIPDDDQVTQWRHAHTSRREPIPDRWYRVWQLSPVLPGSLLQPWRPLLDLLDSLAGPPEGRPKPRWTSMFISTINHAGLPVASFAEQATADGPAAAVRALVQTPVADGTQDLAPIYGGVIAALVAQDPETWAADPAGVAAVAGSVPAQQSYFFALLQVYERQELVPAETLAAVAEAAFDVHQHDQVADLPESFKITICLLLERAWNAGLDLQDGPAMIAWLDQLVVGWTEPRLTTTDPVNAATSLGGTALRALLVWALHRARVTGGGLPAEASQRLDEILQAQPDDQALAVLGLYLSQLAHRDPAWAANHEASLVALDHPWRPAHTWLDYGHTDNRFLARLDLNGLYDVLRTADRRDDGPERRVAFALMDDTTPLGPVGDFLTGLASQDGADAVSAVLSSLASMISHSDVTAPWPERACTVWTCALDADLPAKALAGAGYFASANAIDDARWLHLTARTVARHPAVQHARMVVRRAAAHPTSSDAISIVVAVITDTSPATYATYPGQEILRYANDLHIASQPHNTEGRELLKSALINAGSVETAFTDTGAPAPLPNT